MPKKKVIAKKIKKKITKPAANIPFLLVSKFLELEGGLNCF